MTTSRILIVSGRAPWPPDTGARVRLATIVRGLALAGTVDLALVADPRQWRNDNGGNPIDRIGCFPAPSRSRSGLARWLLHLGPVPWACGRGQPTQLAFLDLADIPARLRAFAGAPYDLVWLDSPMLYPIVADLDLGPLAIDFDDLHDRLLLGRIDQEAAGSVHSGRERVTRTIRTWAIRRDAACWARLQRHMAARAALAVTASELDAERIEVPGALVLQNGYPRPEHPVGRSAPGDPPVLLFIGQMHYGPNADAARFLIDDLAPELRRVLPGARIRLVGAAPDDITRAARSADIELAGRVPDLGPELGAADVMVVPVRYGSGTRIKILEAFAHRIPVVSTTVGAEGLEVVAGEHLLVEDEPSRFADACRRLVTDRELRARLVDAAQQRFLDRYESSVVERRLAEQVALLSGRTP